VHWGLEANTSINRKEGVPPQIPNFTPLGTANILRYADNYTAYSWSDGTPTLATNGTRTGVFLTNLSSGFQLTLPADTTPRLLRLYVGAYAARGRLLAYLSDFSAQPYIDKSVFDVSWDNEYAAYSIAYALPQRTAVNCELPFSGGFGWYGKCDVAAATLRAINAASWRYRQRTA
jgi:hypothetical protein